MKHLLHGVAIAAALAIATSAWAQSPAPPMGNPPPVMPPTMGQPAAAPPMVGMPAQMHHRAHVAWRYRYVHHWRWCRCHWAYHHHYVWHRWGWHHWGWRGYGPWGPGWANSEAEKLNEAQLATLRVAPAYVPVLVPAPPMAPMAPAPAAAPMPPPPPPPGAMPPPPPPGK
jgi:hypothetical protein